MLCPAELLAHMQFLFVSVTPAVENPPDVRKLALYPTELQRPIRDFCAMRCGRLAQNLLSSILCLRGKIKQNGAPAKFAGAPRNTRVP